MKSGKRGRPSKPDTSVDESLIQNFSNVSLEKNGGGAAWTCSAPQELTPGGTELKTNKLIFNRPKQEDDIFSQTIVSNVADDINSDVVGGGGDFVNAQKKGRGRPKKDEVLFKKTYKKQPGHASSQTQQKQHFQPQSSLVSPVSKHGGQQQQLFQNNMNGMTTIVESASSPISSSNHRANAGLNDDGGGGQSETPLAKRTSAGPTPELIRSFRAVLGDDGNVGKAEPTSVSSSSFPASSSPGSGKKGGRKGTKKESKKNQFATSPQSSHHNDTCSSSNINNSSIGSKTVNDTSPMIAFHQGSSFRSSSSSNDATRGEDITTESISSSSSSSCSFPSASMALSISRAGPYSPGPVTGFSPDIGQYLPITATSPRDDTDYESFSPLSSSSSSSSADSSMVQESPQRMKQPSTSTSKANDASKSPENMQEEYRLNAVSPLKSPLQSSPMQQQHASMSPLSPQQSQSNYPVPSNKVAVLAPDACLGHNTGEAHQENVGRLLVLCSTEDGALRRSEFADELDFLSPPNTQYHNKKQVNSAPHSGGGGFKGSRASEADILRVHEWDYIDHLRRQCCRAELASTATTASNLSSDHSVASSDPLHPSPAKKNSNSGIFPTFSSPMDDRGLLAGFFDSDTRLSHGSWNAAQAAVDACITAVDMVMEGFSREVLQGGGREKSSQVNSSHRKAFVAARPPGHHAGSRGCVQSQRHFWQRPDMCSCGFCLLNNVAIAAAYARYKFGKDGLRVAIVDWDIHHGNGTQEIVENLVPRSRCMPLPSSWSPVSLPSFKPWYNSEEDASHVFFSSINLEDGAVFYPGDGASDASNYQTHPDNEKVLRALKETTPNGGGACGALLRAEHAKYRLSDNIVNVTLTPVKGAPPPGDLRGRKKQTVKDRNHCIVTASKQFRDGVSNELLPKLEKFNPDLILISAGFDGHADDFYHYLVGEDYAWITEQLVDLMSTRGGRIISVLEGGYSLAPLNPPAAANPKKMNRSNSSSKLASSVESVSSPVANPVDGGLVKGVMAHLHALAKEE